MLRCVQMCVPAPPLSRDTVTADCLWFTALEGVKGLKDEPILNYINANGLFVLLLDTPF